MKCLTKNCDNQATKGTNYCTSCAENIEQRDKKRIFKVDDAPGLHGPDTVRPRRKGIAKKGNASKKR